jgi:hypothetical protein
VKLGLFDVQTDSNVLNSVSGIQTSIFDDLGSGVSYGVTTIDITYDDNRVLEIPLNTQAIAKLANGTVFSVGMVVLDRQGTGSTYLFGNSGGVPRPFVHELRIQTAAIPEPSSALCGCAVAIAACVTRGRKRQQAA